MAKQNGKPTTKVVELTKQQQASMNVAISRRRTAETQLRAEQEKEQEIIALVLDAHGMTSDEVLNVDLQGPQLVITMKHQEPVKAKP